MYELASDARNTANPAISSGVEPLPKEQFFKKLFLDTSFSNNAALSLVFTYPGHIMLTLMLFLPHSIDWFSQP